MAFPATGVIQVQNGGSDTQCAGGFNAARGGTDYSLQSAAQATGTVTSATTTVTATTGIFTTLMVGNYITDGTTTKEITAFTSATIVTVDSAPSWAAATIFVGGALASPGKAAAIATVAGNIVYVKYNASPFVATTASTSVAGGCVVGTAGTAYAGYDTTRTRSNTDANRPTFQIGGAVSTATLFATAGAISNFILDGNSQTASKATNNITYADRCRAINCTTAGFTGTACYNCVGTTNSGPGFSGSTANYCDAFANTNAGFSNVTCFECNSYGNTGGSGIGFNGCTILDRCNSYGNAQAGFSFTASGANIRVSNLIAESNTGVGFAVTPSSTRLQLFNCASFGNSARSSTASLPIEDVGPIVGTGTFFTNAAGGVFALNSTANQGALCRGTAAPALFPAGLTANAADVGAAQSSAATDYPTAANVRSGTAYSFGTQTGTLAVPNPNTVLTPTPTDATTGTLTLPTAGQVQSGVVFGVGGTGTTGTLQTGGVAAGIALIDTGYWYGKNGGR